MRGFVIYQVFNGVKHFLVDPYTSGIKTWSKYLTSGFVFMTSPDALAARHGGHVLEIDRRVS